MRLLYAKVMINAMIVILSVTGSDVRRASYDVYISQLIRFARVSYHVSEYNTLNKLLTAKLLNQSYRYHKLRKAFSKFYRHHFDLVSKFNVGLKSLLQQDLSEPEFYGDLVYKFRKKYMLAMILAINFVKSFFDI